jgi:hypothetical protein
MPNEAATASASKRITLRDNASHFTAGWYHNPTYSHGMRITNLLPDIIPGIGETPCVASTEVIDTLTLGSACVMSRFDRRKFIL